ncbi:DUF4304 domain-containing protein [Fictibacillus nanhaiensis]|uniref:DUF4304 domain-containing protein n=1 Tax=Fictibacillus nanhaiensis TaxID=742169 RepID=UPI003C25ADD8
MQDVLKQLVKETVAPLLKLHGFKKKGNHFAHMFSEFSWTLNVQSSRWNTNDDVEFTINTGLFINKLYGTYYLYDPPAFPTEVESVLRLRVSELKSESEEHEDIWYKLTPATDIDDLKERIKQDIEDIILPHFEQFRTIQNIIQGLEKREEQGYFEPVHFQTILYKEYGYREAAQKRMNKVYSECETDDQREYTKELAGRLGLEIT